jgi:uncharacterized phage-associated protein
MVDTQTENYGEYVGEKFVLPPNKSFNADLFEAIELETLNEVLATFGKFNASQIRDISHTEKAWIENEKNKAPISYTYGFELTTI